MSMTTFKRKEKRISELLTQLKALICQIADVTLTLYITRWKQG